MSYVSSMTLMVATALKGHVGLLLMMNRTIAALLLCALATRGFGGEANLTFNFVVTVDRAKQDMLLIGPENEDIHIGVIGRKFYPVDQTKLNKAQWPVGKWTASVSPPDDPTPFWWDYELTLSPDGSVEFAEIEHHQEYDKDFKPKGKETTRTRLAMSGHWKMAEGKGQIVFTKIKTEPNKPPATRPVQDVRNFMIHGFKVGVTTDHYWPVVASVFVDPSQFEDARRNEPQIRVVIESQLLGRQKEDVLDPKRSGEIENRIRTEMRGQIPNLTIDRIHLDLDIK